MDAYRWECLGSKQCPNFIPSYLGKNQNSMKKNEEQNIRIMISPFILCHYSFPWLIKFWTSWEV